MTSTSTTSLMKSISDGQHYRNKSDTSRYGVRIMVYEHDKGKTCCKQVGKPKGRDATSPTDIKSGK